MYFYGITQRAAKDKNDLRNASLLKTVAPKATSYAKQRAAEMNLDGQGVLIHKKHSPAHISQHNRLVAG
jgi:hypothetical protein